jgi:hypothetical protein
VFGSRNLLFVFMGGYRGGDEKYPVQLQPVPDLFSSGEVTVMDGVECPAEDADS